MVMGIKSAAVFATPASMGTRVKVLILQVPGNHHENKFGGNHVDVYTDGLFIGKILTPRTGRLGKDGFGKADERLSSSPSLRPRQAQGNGCRDISGCVGIIWDDSSWKSVFIHVEDNVGRAERRRTHDDLKVVQVRVRIDIEPIQVNLMIRVGSSCLLHFEQSWVWARSSV